MYLHCYDHGNIQKMKVVDLTWIERDRGGGGLLLESKLTMLKVLLNVSFQRCRSLGVGC